VSNAPVKPTIDELREDFVGNGLEGWLWPWLERTLESYVRARLKPRYRASLYSPSGEWDESGIHDLVQGFILERVIERGALLLGLQRADNTAGLVHYLERALHNYACSERVRTVSGNIYRRLADVLASDGRLKRLSGIGGRAAYGLQEWSENPPASMTAEDLQEGMKFIPADISWRDYRGGDRHSPGLLNEDLARIAFHIIGGTERLFTASQIMQLVRHWFDIDSGTSLVKSDSDAAAILSSQEPSPLEATVADDLAARALGRLTPDQESVFRLMVSDGKAGVRDLASRLGKSKSFVNRQQKVIGAIFQELNIRDPGEQMQVMSAAARLLGA
jgi:hypothetical protein